MSGGVGPSGDGKVWCDGYSFQGEGVAKDPRHTHAAIHPKFRSAAADLRRGLGGFGWTSGLDTIPMDPAARKRGGTDRGGKGKGREGTLRAKVRPQAAHSPTLQGGKAGMKSCAAGAPASKSKSKSKSKGPAPESRSGPAPGP